MITNTSNTDATHEVTGIIAYSYPDPVSCPNCTDDSMRQWDKPDSGNFFCKGKLFFFYNFQGCIHVTITKAEMQLNRYTGTVNNFKQTQQLKTCRINYH